MLAAGAAEGNHQIFEAALLIAVDARIHQRQDAGEILMHALLLIEIVDDRGVFAGESLEALFASRIREAAAIENEPTAVSRLIFRQVLVKGKTENPHHQIFGFRSEALQFLRGQHAFESVHQRRKGDGEPDVVKEPAEVFQGVGYVLQSAFAAALIIHKKGIAVAQQDVAGLEVAVEKVIARSAQQKFREAAKIVLQGLFVEGDAGETEEIIFEIVQIPRDGLAIEAGDGIADTVVQITAVFELKAGQHGDHFAIGFDDWRSNVFAGAVFGEELEKGGIAEVFLEISALVQSFGVNFRNRKAVV